jgi:hypothetical protein
VGRPGCPRPEPPKSWPGLCKPGHFFSGENEVIAGGVDSPFVSSADGSGASVGVVQWPTSTAPGALALHLRRDEPWFVQQALSRGRPIHDCRCDLLSLGIELGHPQDRHRRVPECKAPDGEIGERPAVKKAMAMGPEFREDPASISAEEQARRRKIVADQRAQQPSATKSRDGDSRYLVRSSAPQVGGGGLFDLGLQK